MINNFLLIVSIIIIFISYTRIILIYIKSKNIKIEDRSGFDLAKDITSNYDEINIVESKEINISKYYLKRKIIRLTPKNYEGNNIFTLAITSSLSGYSLLSINKDKYIELLSKIFPSIDYLNKSILISLIISIMTTNIGDAKIGIILLIIILIYQYLVIQINTESNNYITKELKKTLSSKDKSKIEKILNSFMLHNKLSFIVSLILILREVLIIINI